MLLKKKSRNNRTLEGRFWDKVLRVPGDYCWPWLAATMAGYGVIRETYPGRQMLRAHRVSWEAHNGPIPEDLLVCHHCDNPICCNPDHLFLGTCADNHADRDAKGRQARGEIQHLAKLTVEDVVWIRSENSLTNTEMARALGVTPTAIYYVLRRETWKHVA